MIHVPLFDVSEEDELDLLDAIATLVYADKGWESGAVGSGPWEPEEWKPCGRDTGAITAFGALLIMAALFLALLAAAAIGDHLRCDRLQGTPQHQTYCGSLSPSTGAAVHGEDPAPVEDQTGPWRPRPGVVHRARPPAASRSRSPEPDFAALARCESSDDPHAVSPSGRFRGLYQFDLRTWRSVGGHGDPAQASRAEQTLRAQLLYAERGAQPWPLCGRWLR